ncbi:MAG: NYN domain-containing protein [Myxococcota bacterium]|jgi:uncharacterized LabA/DUF88 family protein|nr:NYN domain-containing protein [Myxococcota bacterium]
MSTHPSSRIRLGVFVDLECVRRNLETGAHRLLDAVDLGARIHGFASTRGRVVLANCYADWAAPRALSARDLRRQGFEPRFAWRREGGGSDLSLILDVMESLGAPQRCDEYLLIASDPDQVELIQRLHRHDRSVVVAGFRAAVAPELIRAADCFMPLEDILLLPSSAGPLADPAASGGSAPAGDLLDEQDVTSLILLIHRLEERLDFVGVGYLIGKAMSQNAVGPEDLRLRRLLFNKLAEEGIVEVYKLENKEAGADPVSACRLDHDHPRVQDVLAHGEEYDDEYDDEPAGDDEP